MEALIAFLLLWAFAGMIEDSYTRRQAEVYLKKQTLVPVKDASNEQRLEPGTEVESLP